MVRDFMKSFKKNWIALLYTILGIEIILYSIYGELKIVNSVFIAIIIIIFFYIYDIVDREKKKGPLIYLITAVVVITISYILVRVFGSKNELEFLDWLLRGGDTVSNEGSYVWGSAIVIAFIFSSMYYYFSIKINRMSVLLLLFFVSMILYIKGPYYQGNIFMYLYIGAFFLNYINGGQILEYPREDNVKIKDLSLSGIIVVLIMFVCVIFIPSNLFPKISALENIKSYFRENAITTSLKGFTVENNKTRKINESTENNSDVIMYSYKGELVPYLIESTYDYYDLNGETWKKRDEEYRYGNNIAIYEKNISVEDTKEFLEYLNNDLTIEVFRNDESEEARKAITIESKYKSGNKLVFPSNTYSIDKLNGNAKIYLNEHNELFQNDSVFDINEKYSVFYYDEIPKDNTRDDYIMKNFNDEIYSEICEEIKFKNELIWAMKSNSKYTEYEKIKRIYTELNENTTNRIRELANNITEKYESPYYKAKAIEEYFRNNDYIYNLNLPEYKGKDYIDFFIFEGKEGYCVQYATAMTLMCRAAGVPARYVEGYIVIDEDKIKDGYNVNAKRAHAFVQVYIPGYGWKIFDPTPSTDSEEVINYYSINNNRDFNFIVPLAILIIIVVIAIYLLLTKKKRKIKMIMKLPRECAIEELIKNSISELNKIGLKLRKEETLICFAKRVDKRVDINFEKLVDRYYECKYGKENFEEIDLKYAVQIYEDIRELVKSES